MHRSEPALPLRGGALVTNQRPPQRDGSLLRVPAVPVPSARSRVGGRGRRRRCPPVAPPNPIASTTPLIGRRQRLSRRRRRRTAAVVDDHPSSGMPCVANERQSRSGPSPVAWPLPSRSSLRHGDGHAACADVRHGRRPFFSSMGPAAAAPPSHHASLRASTPAERWSRISAAPEGRLVATRPDGAGSVGPISRRGKRTTTSMTAGYGCGSDFGGAAGDHVPSSPSLLRISMARRRCGSSPPCVLHLPQYLLPLSLALRDTSRVLPCPVLLVTY